MPSHFSRVRLFATPWTVAHQAPLSMGFSRQEPSPRGPSGPRIAPRLLGLLRCSWFFSARIFRVLFRFVSLSPNGALRCPACFCFQS